MDLGPWTLEFGPWTLSLIVLLHFLIEVGAGKVGKYLVHQRTLGEEHHPNGEEDQQQVNPAVAVIVVPHLQVALEGLDDVAHETYRIHGFGDVVLLITEYHTANARQSRRHRVVTTLGFIAVGIIAPLHHRARTNDAHAAEEDVEQLRQLVQLGLAQEAPKGQYTRVVARGDRARTHVRTVLQHGGKLQHPEGLSSFPYSGLLVKDFMLTRTQQDDHDGN